MSDNETDNKLTATIDMNAFFKAYSSKDFMIKVFKDFLKENPALITEHIQTFVLVEVLKSNEIENITKAVNASIIDRLTRLTTDYQFDAEIRKETTKVISTHIPKITQIVRNHLSEKDFKEGDARKIKNEVEHLVLTAMSHIGYEAED